MSEWWTWTLCSKFPLHKHFGKYLFICGFKKLIVLKFHEASIGFMALTEELNNTIFLLASSKLKNPFLFSWLIIKSILDLSLTCPSELYPYNFAWGTAGTLLSTPSSYVCLWVCYCKEPPLKVLTFASPHLSCLGTAAASCFPACSFYRSNVSTSLGYLDSTRHPSK